MKKIIIWFLFVFLATIITPAVSQDAIGNVDGGNSDNGHWVYFETENFNGFTGSYMHYHVYNASYLSGFLDSLNTLLGVTGFAAAKLGSDKSYIFGVIGNILDLAATSAKNNDGSYDFYILKAKNESGYSYIGFISKDTNSTIGLKASLSQIDAPNVIRSMEPQGMDSSADSLPSAIDAEGTD